MSTVNFFHFESGAMRVAVRRSDGFRVLLLEFKYYSTAVEVGAAVKYPRSYYLTHQWFTGTVTLHLIGIIIHHHDIHSNAYSH